MYSDLTASARRRAKTGMRPLAAFAAFSLFCSIVPAATVDASVGTHLERIKGTVGYATGPGAPHHDVTTSADVADGSDTYSKCSSLAALSFSSGATAMLGGSTDFKAPADGTPGTLSDGIVQYRTDAPFAIATKYGTVAIKRGTGYVLSGRDGVEIISVDAGSNDVVYTTAAGSFAVPGGQTLAQPITSGKPGTALLLANTAVNNPATYQFAQGRNPLGTTSVKPLDPTGTRTADCKVEAGAAGAEIGAIVAALLGAGAVAAGSHGGGTGGDPGGNISPSSPTPFPSGNISPSSPTPFPSTPATGSPSSAPSGSPSTSPSGAPSTSPSGGPSGSPQYGAVILNPSAILLNPGIGQTASATVSASQSGFTGAYTASVTGCSGVGATPRVSVVSTGPGTANVVLTDTGAANLNLGCTLEVTGGGGVMGSAAVAITLAAQPTPAPTSSASPNPGGSPTAAPTLGPVTLAPNAVVLNPGLGSAANATIAASQPGYTGTYKAVVDGCVGVGTKPKVTVTSTGPGTANVTLSATGVANLNLACSVKVTGGGGKSAAAPVAVSLAVVAPTPAPSTSPSSSPSGSPHGPLVLNPTSILLDPGIGAPATATVAASESGYTGTFTASVTGCVGVGTPPKATVTSTGPGTANVTVTATGSVNLNLGCTLDVKGGGMSATAPVAITLSALSTPTPTPAPTSSGVIGNLTVTPNAVLVNPGLGSAASAKLHVTQPNFAGPFTATVAGCSGVGSAPVAAVTSNGVGKATVTVTASGVINANLACNVTITGGNGATATVPVTVTLAALPSATPTPAGPGPGAITANPAAVLLLPGVGSNASANVVVSQANFTGTFGATLSCPVGLGGQPDVTVSSDGTAGQGVVTITVPGALSAAVACNVHVTGGGGKKLDIPVTVGAAIGGGATPTPAPGGTGPLTANPGSILLNPGVTTSATQSIALSDPGYTGAYGASVACATAGLSPVLRGVFVTPTVSVSGSTLTITSPGQVLGIALGCNVTVTTSVPQSLTVPVTISVTAVNGLARRSARAGNTAGMVFTPASVALQPHGGRATGSFDVAGVTGPLSTSVACPAGTSLTTTTLGDRVELEQLAAAVSATCMVTVTGGGTSSQVPVRTYAVAGATPANPVLGGSPHVALGRPSMALRVGETQSVSIASSGPIDVSGCEALASVRVTGGMLVATGHATGRCTLTVRGPGGAHANLSISVGATALPAIGRGRTAP